MSWNTPSQGGPCQSLIDFNPLFHFPFPFSCFMHNMQHRQGVRFNMRGNPFAKYLFAGVADAYNALNLH